MVALSLRLSCVSNLSEDFPIATKKETLLEKLRRKKDDDEQRHHHPNDHDEDFLFHIPGLFYPRSILDDEKGEEEERDVVEEDGSESIVLVAFVVLVVSVPNKPFKESGGEVYIHRFLVLDNLHRDNNFA